jgi:hypothetical protein
MTTPNDELAPSEAWDFLPVHSLPLAKMLAGRRIGLASGHSPAKRFRSTTLAASCALLIFAAVDSWASAGGSISGSVLDASGAVVPSASVKAANVDTGIERQATTNDRGFYSFPGSAWKRADCHF